MTNTWRISVPGRVNLIGEHIDYHNRSVFPMAIQRRIHVDFEAIDSPLLHAESSQFGVRELHFSDSYQPGPPGDWANYLKAALQAVQMRWPITNGFRALVNSDLPPAAGLSSSSALLTAFTLGLLRANRLTATLDELMTILPDGEHFVGTRGGGMDHAAVLASIAGHALLIHFMPFEVEHVCVPDDWRFLVAHSLTRAEKSGAAKARYNACRAAGMSALEKRKTPNCVLSEEERDALTHILTEADRVTLAVSATRAGDRRRFGNQLSASHESLRDKLKVSCSALDRIVEVAMHAGADGARLTGAGFGGCAVILSTDKTQAHIMAALERDFYRGQSEYSREEHLIPVQPSNGALYENEN